METHVTESKNLSKEERIKSLLPANTRVKFIRAGEIKITRSMQKSAKKGAKGKQTNLYILDMNLVLVNEDSEELIKGFKKDEFRCREKHHSKNEAIEAGKTFEKRKVKELTEKYIPEIRMNQLIDEYLSEKAKVWRPETIRTNKSVFVCMLKPYFDDCTLTEAVEKVKQFQNVLVSTKVNLNCNDKTKRHGISSNYASKVYHNLRSFLSFIYGKGYTPVDYTMYLGQKHKQIRKGRPRTTALFDEEITQYLEVCNGILKEQGKMGRQLYLALQIIIFTGLRVGELFGLRVGDYDKQHKMLSVKGSLHARFKGENRYGATKTESSVRSIPVNKIVERAIVELLSMREKDYTEFPSNLDFDEIPLFLDDGNYFSEKTREHWYGKCQKKYEELYGKHIVIHDLRRTACTLNYDDGNGMSMKSLSGFMGHANTEVTQNVYLVLQERKRKAEMEAINKKNEAKFSNLISD